MLQPLQICRQCIFHSIFPKSDVLKFILEDNCSVVVRPSGTEPKLKTYISVSAQTETIASNIEENMVRDLENKLK